MASKNFIKMSVLFVAIIVVGLLVTLYFSSMKDDSDTCVFDPNKLGEECEA